MERDGVAKLRSELAAIIEEHMPSSAHEISGGAAVSSLAEIGLQRSRMRLERSGRKNSTSLRLSQKRTARLARLGVF